MEIYFEVYLIFVSRSVMSDSLRPHRLYSSWISPSQNNGVDSLSFLQGISPTQESNWGLLHCRQILYQLSYQGSPDTIFKGYFPFCYYKISGCIPHSVQYIFDPILYPQIVPPTPLIAPSPITGNQ